MKYLILVDLGNLVETAYSTNDREDAVRLMNEELADEAVLHSMIIDTDVGEVILRAYR